VFRVLRSGSLALVLAAALAGWATAGPEAPKPTPTPTPRSSPTPSAKKPGDAPKRVFTNDDLEATKDKPSAVQDLSATGGATTMPAEPVRPPDTPDEPAPEPTDTRTEEERRLQEAEATVKALDEQANQLLWEYLQSTDTNEILRLKAEQKEVLDRLEAAKAELARLRGEAGVGPPPTPTRQPG
jgi:hypothetical protein